MTDGDVTDDAGVVVIVVAAEAVEEFAGDRIGDVGSLIERGVAEDNQPTPQTSLVNAKVAVVENVVRFGSHDNRLLGRAVSVNLCATGDEESGGVVGAAGFAFDDRACFDGQRGIADNVDHFVQHVLVRSIPSLVTEDVRRHLDDVLVAARNEVVSRERRPAVNPQVIIVERTLVGSV